MEGGEKFKSLEAIKEETVIERLQEMLNSLEGKAVGFASGTRHIDQIGGFQDSEAEEVMEASVEELNAFILDRIASAGPGAGLDDHTQKVDDQPGEWKGIVLDNTVSGDSSWQGVNAGQTATAYIGTKPLFEVYTSAGENTVDGANFFDDIEIHNEERALSALDKVTETLDTIPREVADNSHLGTGVVEALAANKKTEKSHPYLIADLLKLRIVTEEQLAELD